MELFRAAVTPIRDVFMRAFHSIAGAMHFHIWPRTSTMPGAFAKSRPVSLSAYRLMLRTPVREKGRARIVVSQNMRLLHKRETSRPLKNIPRPLPYPIRLPILSARLVSAIVKRTLQYNRHLSSTEARNLLWSAGRSSTAMDFICAKRYSQLIVCSVPVRFFALVAKMSAGVR